MKAGLKTTGWKITRALVALALFCMTFGPMLDTAAKLAPEHNSSGSPMQFLRAFDVIDDPLDHLSSQRSAAVQLHIQIAHALPDAVAAPGAIGIDGPAWEVPTTHFPTSVSIASQKPPPRA
ncbi:MAG: hypothetical protein WCI21_01910 [Alphaproteobacteria bacterium]